MGKECPNRREGTFGHQDEQAGQDAEEAAPSVYLGTEAFLSGKILQGHREANPSFVLDGSRGVPVLPRGRQDIQGLRNDGSRKGERDRGKCRSIDEG